MLATSDTHENPQKEKVGVEEKEEYREKGISTTT